MAAQHFPIECVASIGFGVGGNAGAHVVMGWASAEPGFTWSLEDESRLALPQLDISEAHDHWLELRLNPFRVPGRLDSQRLEVKVNGVTIGADRIAGAATLAYAIPHQALAAASGGRSRVTLLHPDFAQPSSFGVADDRPLGFMLFEIRLLRRPRRARASITALPPLMLADSEGEIGYAVLQSEGIPATELVSLFDNLGWNCEFGLVQRKLGAEPLGLLRFSAIDLTDLMAGLRSEFEGLGDELHVTIEGVSPDSPGDYMVHDKRYALAIHSFTKPGTDMPERVSARTALHLRRLRQAFFERLTLGDHIAVIHRRDGMLAAEALALLLALQGFGPTALLFVDRSPDLPRGAVEQLDHGLFHGKLDWFAPGEDVSKSDLLGWVSLCINARRLWRLGR